MHPMSPDLSPCKYFLWYYLKSQVYRDRPNLITDDERQHPTAICYHTYRYVAQCAILSIAPKTTAIVNK
ncbi:hypothetical protein TNCV_3876751 [Trichonephila clavipes]|uniref:Uncharacterized protein n=1 Tax=Trichonephila clavipes TaxID=2585209 RepID=A0A8X6T0P7_TRICX|nr:hypothetical protein TNCV_3876751 [Trichonephila clavipes]